MWTRLGTAGLLVVASCGIAAACDKEAKSTVRSRVLFKTAGDQEAKAYFGIQLGQADEGIKVIEVIDDSPAERAGFEDDDVILAFGDEDIDGVEHFVKIVGNAQPGDDVLVEYSRDGVTRTRTITLGTRSDMPHVMSIGKGHGLPDEVMESLHSFDGGAISVEVECEDGRGVATIERDGEVIETHEFDCDEDNEHNMNIFKFHGDDEGQMWFGDKGAHVIDLKEHMGQIELLQEKLGNLEIDDEHFPYAIMSRARGLGRLDREPTIRFREDSDGHIEVVIRKGDTELIKEFRDADDLARRNEELFEKYEKVQE